MKVNYLVSRNTKFREQLTLAHFSVDNQVVKSAARSAGRARAIERNGAYWCIDCHRVAAAVCSIRH